MNGGGREGGKLRCFQTACPDPEKQYARDGRRRKGGGIYTSRICIDEVIHKEAEEKVIGVKQGMLSRSKKSVESQRISQCTSR